MWLQTSLYVKSVKSRLAEDTNPIDVEVDLDSLYHEFGHFIVYEYSQVLPVIPDVSVHPNLKGFISPGFGACHLGYNTSNVTMLI